jgi:ABC-2 type transport system ATP-binding protein
MTAPAQAPVIEMRDVTKRYEDVVALDGIDLEVRRGEIVAFLGPNGAGKTTTIALMLGLRRASSGSVRVFGLSPLDRRARTLRGAMLQDTGLLPLLTVREIVDLFRAYYPSPLPTSTVLGLTGLEEKARARVSTLSGGQKQRLAYGLAICGDPAALFLDEPTVGMDVSGRRAFLQEIGSIADEGRTVFLTTHFLDEADAIARRIVVIDRGRIVADGTPAQIKSRAAGRRVSFHAEPVLTEDDLAGLPVTALSISNHSVRFLTNEPETVLAEVFRRGGQLSELEVTGADLEEAFLLLTGPREGAT